MSTPSTTDTDTGGRPAPSTTSYFSRGVEVAAGRPWLALAPLVAGLLSLDQLERAARADVTMQINFGLPTPVAGVWTFLNAPTESGVSVFGYSSTAVANRPELLLTGVGVAGGSLLLVGLLTAVYLGSIDDALAGQSSDPLDNLRRYAPVTLVFAALQFCFLLVLLVLGGGVLAARTGAAAALFVPVFIAALVGYYLLAPGVYVGVAADLDVVPAFRRGARVALTADYVVFALAYAALVAVCSVPLSSFAFTAGLPTILATALVAAPVGLALNAATMAFVRYRVGEASDTTRPPRDDDTPDAGQYEEKGDGIDGIVMGMGPAEDEDGDEADNRRDQ
ncbi:hypothetical protein [Haloglomus litoreum]|uniref:hypothetical protein n=1 Tax=Haloglomus litoreum TaxID=3034026 RepID=UPI0023E858F9|nr:hypothetical protein [Haloglomus sp. DT116]